MFILSDGSTYIQLLTLVAKNIWEKSTTLFPLTHKRFQAQLGTSVTTTNLVEIMKLIRPSLKYNQ